MAKKYPRQANAVFSIALLALTIPCAAAEPSGCEGFKWPIAREQAALAAAPDKPVEKDGAITVGKAVRAKLAPADKIQLPHAPGRDVVAGTFATVLNLSGPPAAGVYTVSLSGGAWIDVFQDNLALKPMAHSGAKDCPNIRKTLKFQLAPLNTVI